MDAQEIKDIRLADPFRPFNLVMNDGRKLPVDKPYFLAISGDRQMLVHSSLNGGFECLRPESVRSVEFFSSAEAADSANQRAGAA